MKKCIYCKNAIDESSVMDFCERCGVKVWGPKMYKTILQGFEEAGQKGNLDQGNSERLRTK